MAETEKQSWQESFAIYFSGRVLAMFFLGFSAGLPLILVFSTLSAWLRDVGVTRTAIGFFSWVALAYSIKVFWSPLVDQVRLPVLHKLLGRRRSWMLLTQVIVACGLAGMALTDPVSSTWTMAVFAVLAAFASATQDIAIDAWRIEAAPEDMQGAMAGAYQAGYMVAIKIIGGAVVLYVAQYASWTTSYLIMAGLMGVGFITVLLIHEPESHKQLHEELSHGIAVAREKAEGVPRGLVYAATWFMGAIVGPFADFFKRNGWVAIFILLFVATFRLSDITLGVMANPFYIDLGFSKADIATATKVVGLWVAIGGAVIGGVLVARYGVMKSLILSCFLLTGTNLLFALLAFLKVSNFWALTVAVSADTFAFGISGSAFIAYLSSLTSVSYTATQYALFSSLMLLPGKLLAGFSGVIVDATSYVVFFLYASVLGIPSIMLVFTLVWLERAGHLKRQSRNDGESEAPESEPDRQKAAPRPAG